MIGFVLTVAIVGFLVWLVTTKIPMDPTIAITLQVIVVICVVLYFLRLVGFADLPLPRIR